MIREEMTTTCKAICFSLTLIHCWQGIDSGLTSQKIRMKELYRKSVVGLGPCHPISFHCSDIKPFRETLGKAMFHNALRASCHTKGPYDQLPTKFIQQ